MMAVMDFALFLINLNAWLVSSLHKSAMGEWRPIATAPADRELQLSVIEKGEVYALSFPCRRREAGWINAETGKLVFVEPTHWRFWPKE